MHRPCAPQPEPGHGTSAQLHESHTQGEISQDGLDLSCRRDSPVPQSSPSKPASQKQRPNTHWPWPEQSDGHGTGATAIEANSEQKEARSSTLLAGAPRVAEVAVAAAEQARAVAAAPRRAAVHQHAAGHALAAAAAEPCLAGALAAVQTHALARTAARAAAAGTHCNRIRNKTTVQTTMSPD